MASMPGPVAGQIAHTGYPRAIVLTTTAKTHLDAVNQFMQWLYMPVHDAELLGVERKAAAHFTFYLAVPTMFGASVYELYKLRDTLTGANYTLIAVGFVVSFVVAWIVVKTFIAFVGRYGLKPFGWYRIAAGLAIIALLVSR